MTTNKLLFTLVLALTVWPGHATAQDVSDSDRFQLFNECGPMRLLVEDEADWADIGLTVDRLQTMAESRLRAARLYDATALTVLYVNVNVAGRGYSQDVNYSKLVYVKRPQFSWTLIRGESNVQGGGGNGSIEERAGEGVGGDGGSPEGDRSARRRRGR